MERKSIKVLFDSDSRFCEERLRYVLDFLQNHPLATGQVSFVTEGPAAQTIHYQQFKTTPASSFFIPAQGCFFKKEKINSQTFVANAFAFEDLSLFSVEKSRQADQEFLSDRVFSFDILETLFFHISRYEEWYCPEEQWDAWDMMQSTAQFLVRHQLHRRPVVDILVYAFFKALGLPVSYLPTVYCLSHDIDEVQKFSSPWRLFRSAGALLWRGRSLSSQWRLWRAYFATKDPFDTFDWMLKKSEAEEKYIYFLAGGNSVYDTPYDLDNERIKEVFNYCKTRGYIIGIHPSYNAWRATDLFRSEKEQLEAVLDLPIRHSRQHYLHFDFKQTPLVLEQNEIEKDASLGFNDCIGFRCGTGFSYHLYNFAKEQPYRFLEQPLVLMDSSLMSEGAYDPEQVQTLWQAFLKENSHLTQITFNFHNSRFFDAWVHHIPLRTMYENLFRNAQ